MSRARIAEHVCGRRTTDRSLSLCTAAGDTYKLANQVLIPARFTPIGPYPTANTLIRPLILQDKSFRSSYGPFVVGIGNVSTRGRSADSLTIRTVSIGSYLRN